MEHQVKPGASPSPLGLYLHVPFCATTCDFCAFYQEAPRREALDRYLEAIEAELRLIPPGRPVETIFWGGGTPGLLPAADLARLARAFEPWVQPGAEWSVEMAPSVVRADKVETLLDAGVNRLSLGVQSFDAGTLERLGRRHAPERAREAIRSIREAGGHNLNLDLIFAIPGQTLEEWVRDLEAAIKVNPEHISTYCLTFEEDTALWLKAREGRIVPRSEEEEAAFYETTWKLLQRNGFEQYEVSNFARPGFACQHNLHTWRMHEWIGYGPGAASQYQGARYSNVADLERWCEGIACGSPAREETVLLDDLLLAGDCLIFGLRMNAGVSLRRTAGRFPSARSALIALEPLWEDLQHEGLMERNAATDIIRLTDSGRLIADRIGTAILTRLSNPERKERAEASRARFAEPS